MGGNALKKTPLRRISAEEYKTLYIRVLQIVRKYYQYAKVPACLLDKSDFGDLDVVVAGYYEQSSVALSNTLPQSIGKLPTAARLLAQEFESKEVVVNGLVTSFEVDQFQVDIIQASPSNLDFAVSWMSWSDVGNIIGVVANALGLTFGPEGLAIIVLSPRHVTHLGRVILTQNFDDAISFLGYDYRRWEQGFANQKDAFEYLVSGTYFEPWMFKRENLTRNSKERVAKRPMFRTFINYVQKTFSTDSEPDPEDDSLSSDEVDPSSERAESQHESMALRAAHRLRALEHFDKHTAYQLFVAKDTMHSDIKQRFLPAVDNIRVAKSLGHKQLGEFIASYKASKAAVHIDCNELFADADSAMEQIIAPLSNWEKWVLSQKNEQLIVRDMELYYTDVYLPSTSA